MFDQLGIRVSVSHRHNEVRSMRGIAIEFAEQPGLCRKTRPAIAAAIRRGLETHPEVAWRLPMRMTCWWAMSVRPITITLPSLPCTVS